MPITKCGIITEDYEFNSESIVELTLNDLKKLEKDVQTHKLPKTDGFFFGESINDDETKEKDLKFIRNAKQIINNGYKVFYKSWW
jgi:hypothetical protein